jgi:hypothetical protein
VKRALAAFLAVVLALPTLAAAAPSPSAAPFPVVRIEQPAARSYQTAWVCFAAGAGLVTGSFLIHERANRTYRDYLHSTDPGRIDDLYDRTATLDRTSAATLIAGEAVFACGIYLRFLRSPPAARMTLDLGPSRCGASVRF